jgi:hypothetical protein
MTVLINLWFAVPLLTMMREDMNVSSLARRVETLTLYASQLFINFTINGNTRNVIGLGINGVMPLHIGLPILVGVVCFVYLLVDNIIKEKKQENVILVFLGFGALSAYATTNLFPWAIIVRIPVIGNAAKMIQFPWRMLSFATAFLSIVAAYGIFYIVKNKEIRKVLVVAVFAMSTLFAAQYLDDFLNKDIYCYKGATVANVGIGTGEYYYDGTSYTALQKRGEVVTGSSDAVLIQSFERVNGKFTIEYKNSSSADEYIEVPLAYYPFYKAVLNDNKTQKITKGENNVVRISIPANSEGSILIKYHKEFIWLIADLISAIAIIAFLLSYSELTLKRKTMRR